MKANFPAHKRLNRTLIATLTIFLCATGLLLFCPAEGSHAQQEPNRQLVQTASANATNGKRIALVIGNGAYTNAPPLKNPPNDAREMAATLKTLGFDVSNGVNVSQREMKRLIREFGQKLKAGGNGLFYYAGHGVQARGHNYIIPVDADIQSEADVEDSGVDVGLVLNYMDDAQNGLNIVILDACRNNPFSRSFRSTSEGLAQVDAPTGTLIAYATAPGRVAADGAGANGLYTSELLKAMRQPGLTATDMFMQVRAEVMKRTGNKQVPWEASSLVGLFYFSGGPTNLSLSNNRTNNPAPAETRFDAAAFEYSYWETIKNSTSADEFKAYLSRYPEGQFASLAKVKIKNLEVVTKSTEPEPTSRSSDATEVAFWDYIKNSSHVEDFQAYLKRYPSGAFSDLASNRLRGLEAATKEKEEADEARRLEAEAAKPIKNYDVEIGKKDSLTGEAYDPAKLIFVLNEFRVERDPEGLRAESKIYASIYKEDFETALERQKKFYQHWDCAAFKAARTDKVIIREIQPRKNDPWRLRFKSSAEAAQALAEIQGVCNRSAQVTPTSNSRSDSLEGTTWRGASPGGDKQYEFQFLPGGVYRGKATVGKYVFNDTGTWKHVGNTVSIDSVVDGFPGKHALTEATINQDTMQGSSTGGKYKFTMRKIQ